METKLEGGKNWGEKEQKTKRKKRKKWNHIPILVIEYYPGLQFAFWVGVGIKTSV